MRTAVLIFSLLLPASISAERYWATVQASSAWERSLLSQLGMSVDEISVQSVSGVADARILEALRRAGFRVLSAVDIDNKDFPPDDMIYHTYAEVQAALQGAAAQAPGYASLFSIGRSIQGRELTGIRFHRDEGRPKPGVLFIGNHHAREHLSTEIPLLLAGWIAANSASPDVRRLLDSRDIYIIPLLNPDGSEHDVATGRYRLHRKNMRPNPDGSVGVDLNRNYSWGWGGPGASDYPAADTYRGPAPFSEPESQAVRDFVVSHPNLTTMLSYHSYSELVLYPWSGSDDAIPDARALSAFRAMAQAMGEMTGYQPMQSSALYVSSGDTCDWAWGERRIFCFTFELTPRSMGQGGFYPGAAAIQHTFSRNIAPAMYLTDMADDPYRALNRN